MRGHLVSLAWLVFWGGLSRWTGEERGEGEWGMADVMTGHCDRALWAAALIAPQ